MLRVIAGLVAGLIVALLAIYVIWLIGLQVYPIAPESSLGDLESQGALIRSMPLGAHIFIALAWLGGAFLGSRTAAQITRRSWAGWIIAALVACISISNIIMFPHPEWMQVAAFIVPVLGGLAGTRWAARTLREGFIGGEALDA